VTKAPTISGDPGEASIAAAAGRAARQRMGPDKDHEAAGVDVRHCHVVAVVFVHTVADAHEQQRVARALAQDQQLAVAAVGVERVPGPAREVTLAAHGLEEHVPGLAVPTAPRARSQSRSSSSPSSSRCHAASRSPDTARRSCARWHRRCRVTRTRTSGRLG